MLLHDKTSNATIEITDLETLFNPLRSEITGRAQEGQEEQDPTPYNKQDLIFTSGESLPRCWVDADYRNN